MTDNDSSLQLLQKLCDIQQQQLNTLTELLTRLSQMETQLRQTNEDFQQQNKYYDQDRREYKERSELYTKQLSQGRIGAWILLGAMALLSLMAFAIIVSHFF